MVCMALCTHSVSAFEEVTKMIGVGVKKKGSLIIFLPKVFAYTQSHTTQSWKIISTEKESYIADECERYDENAQKKMPKK